MKTRQKLCELERRIAALEHWAGEAERAALHCKVELLEITRLSRETGLVTEMVLAPAVRKKMEAALR